MTVKHIFVADDERNIRNILEKFLVKEGYRVTLFHDGTQIAQEVERLQPDLLVLDIMMPHVDGLEVCRDIRAKSDIPIIFVSARDEELDRVLGLELGADDYLTKPFSPRELVVRIKNIFKRIHMPQKNEPDLQIKDVRLLLEQRKVQVKNQEISLTGKEYELLSHFIQNKNMPFTREQLIEKIWGYDYVGDGRIIDDLIKRIRKKLAQCKSELEITTVWGYGYRVDE
ncbi:response regulator transcription factor [Longirhabdus pacifica]|uniref:response regulator transcription factor n=1 Tax=Longirhabdus pacifica TaxID=2305227 RepID=UPI00197E222F|nr:response regulator transcription factor [Longirhabdus pacifica]